MVLDITETSIGVCIGDHPTQDGAIRRIDPIRLLPSSSHEVAEHIDTLAKEHNVCAVVVGWPLQPEGNPGKPCGKVLHTLENLMDRKRSLVSKKRPFTLWDDRYAETSPTASTADEGLNCKSVENDQPPDQWGRCTAYARAPTSKDGDTYCSRAAYRRPAGDGSERASGIFQHFLGSFYSGSIPTSCRGSVTADYRKVTNDSWEEEALM